MAIIAAKSWTSLCIFLCVTIKRLQGRPTIDLSNGNTVVPDGGLTVRGTTTLCYNSPPTFTWEYSTDGGFTPVPITGDPVTAISGGSCGGGSSLYTGSVIVRYNPVLYGQDVKLRLTVNNNPALSITSTGTLSFQALYNLTGSSAMALLGQTFTWTCQMILPPNDTIKLVNFFRNETNIGRIGYVSECKGFSVDSKYTYNCTSQEEFSLIIPQQNMTESEQNTIWRCAHFGNKVPYSSAQKRLRIAIPISSVYLEPSEDPLLMTEGEQKTLICRVNDNAFPTPTYRWFIGTREVGVNTSNITVTGKKSENRMSLKCQATNNNKSMNASIILSVLFKPEVSTTTSSPYKVVEGQTATMTCSVTAAKPNTDIRWSWIKTDSPSNVLHTDPTYTISNIQRGRSGTYNCRATNTIGTSTPATIQVDVQYGPALVMFSPDVITINETENQTVSPVSCSAVCNPTCTYRWTGVTTVNTGVLDLGVLKRTDRGEYTCTANNTIKSISRTITVYVNYPPITKVFQASGNRTYEESSPFSFTCKVDSYPFSDINILNVDEGEIKASSGPLESLTYKESSAKCFHTGNYSCNSSNLYGSTSSVVQQIFVLCRPRPFDGRSQIDIGIKTNEGLNITAKFIGYPPPGLSWKFRKNLTDVNKTLSSEYLKSSVLLNVSTVQTVLTKETLNEDEFGFYTVTATTPGKPQISIITYNVLPERKPNPPYNISTNCEFSRGTAIVHWVPGFDGGAEQIFLVSYSTNDDDERITTVNYKQPNATITGLNDNTLYFFKVIANNSNGKTLSEDEDSCKTQVKITSTNSLPVIAGGAAGGVVFAGLVVIGILLVLRRINSDRKKDFHQSKRVLNEDVETDEDDGVKDNILYISAGPREEEKPGMSGAAVYAEVNKKGSSSDNNANVYAEVQKSGNKAKDEAAVYSDVVKPKKGLFKKEVKPKPKKEKKQKMKKENTDVYENSEDIAMTQNLDDVYSNTADNNRKKTGNRGYKNQDGLLYVEVQFDQTRENGKPVIHGEDEKTDYATVEFPFPSSSNSDVPQK